MMNELKVTVPRKDIFMVTKYRFIRSDSTALTRKLKNLKTRKMMYELKGTAQEKILIFFR